MLLIAYKNVELEAALNCLSVYVDSLGDLIGSNEISAAYFAGEVESLAKGNLNKRELVCNVFLGFGLRNRSDFLQLKGNKSCGELANAGVASVDVGGLGSAYGVKVAVSAKIVIGAVHVGSPSLGLCIVGVNRGACSVKLNGELAFSIVVNGDVLLFFAYKDVELEATFNCFSIYVDRLVSLVGGNKISAAYFAGEVKGLAKGNLNKRELVCNVCSGLGLFYGNVGCGSKGCKACGELANAGVVSVDVGGLGSAYGVEVAVSAKVVIGAVHVGSPSLGLCIVGVNRGACSVKLNGELAFSIVINGDVLLFFTLEDVELEAAFSFLYIYVDRLVSLVGGNKVSAAYFAGEVKGLAKGNLVQEELVSYACLGSFNVGRNIQILGCSINLNGEGCGFGNFAALDGSGEGEFNLFLAKSDSELAFFDSESLGVDRPSDGNVIVVGADCGESNGCVFADELADGDSILFSSNLLCGSLNDLFEVLEAVNAHRNEVRIAVIENENTGGVCSPTEVLVVSCIDFSLLVGGKGGGEVGDVGTNITGLAVQLEVEVLGGFLVKFLVSDLNALNGYGETNEILEILAVSKLLGDIDNINSLDGCVNDSCGSFVDFLHTGVGLYRAGDLNGHTDFDAIVSDGILGHAVAVVTALAVKVSEEEVVVLVTLGYGVNSNNDTLNNNIVAFFCCHIVLKAGEVVLRNGQLELLLCAGAIHSSNGSGQNVVYFFGGFFVNVNDHNVFVLFNKGYLVGVNGPGNVMHNAVNANLSGYFKVSCGDGLVFVEVVNVLCGCLYIKCVIAELLEVIQKLIDEIAGCEGGYTQSQGQQNY